MTDERCEAQRKKGTDPCARGDYCNDPETHKVCSNGAGANGKAEAEAAPDDELNPGDSLDIRMGRLESGEWYASVGETTGEEGELVGVGAWPHKALQELAKLLKADEGRGLGAYRIAGGPGIGGCIHASSNEDGGRCELLDCLQENAEGYVQTLQRVRQEAGAALIDGGSEIVRLYGKLEKPRLVGDEAGEELTVTVKSSGPDLVEEYLAAREEASKSVVAIIYHRTAAPAKAKSNGHALPVQAPLPIGGEPEVVQPSGPTPVKHGAYVCIGVCGRRWDEGEDGCKCPLCKGDLIASDEWYSRLCDVAILANAWLQGEGRAHDSSAMDRIIDFVGGAPPDTLTSIPVADEDLALQVIAEYLETLPQDAEGREEIASVVRVLAVMQSTEETPVADTVRKVLTDMQAEGSVDMVVEDVTVEGLSEAEAAAE